ncbi:autotransporter domain-containing protein, partial [Fusobacterium ulcerans]|nr:autotransporter domain-containing protein [Fusobacterium ulcerans]
GKLMLALNGAGNKSVVSFGDTALDGSLVTAYETKDKGEITFATTSLFHEVKRIAGKNNEVIILSLPNLPTEIAYEKLNEIYHSILSVDELRNFSVDDNEKLTLFLSYLNDIYAGNPYSYSSELSRKSAGMFRDIVTDNQFKADTGKWMIYGGLTHVDGGTKDTYYGKGYYTYDIGSNDMDADTKITGAYMLGEYGVSDTLTSGVVIGGNKLKSDLSNSSKVDGSALYLGAYAKKYLGN